MPRDLKPQLWTLLLGTAMLVAVTAADCLRAIGLRGGSVAAFCVASSAVLGLLLWLEPIVDRRRRLRLARQVAQVTRKDASQPDKDGDGGAEDRK